MKGMLHLLGIRDIKNMHSANTRSIPKVQRSSYLALYMLRLEKDRLEKEIFVLDKRRSGLNIQLNNIHKRIETLQKEADKGQRLNAHGRVPTRPLKTMDINY